MLLFAAVAALGGCVTDGGGEARDAMPRDNMLDVEWTMVGASDSPGVPDPVACTDVISHPCPFVLYTHTLVLDGHQATWTDASGGTDQAGVAAEDRLPWVDTVTSGEDGSLTFDQRGDDGGLRHEFTLAPDGEDGFAADVTWNLFTVAGATTFHLEAH